MAARVPSDGLRVAIVGASSLRGKELKQVLEDRSFPVKTLSLLDDDEAVGGLTEFEGEPALVTGISEETFRRSDLVFFASTSSAFTRAHWPAAAASEAALVDLSHALLDAPEAVVRVPFLEDSLPAPPSPPPRGGSAVPAATSSPRPWYIAPHAATIVLLSVLTRLSAAFRLRYAVANVFQPVSERGASGIEELQEQTVRLLSFKDYPRKVFDAQVAFNLLAEYGGRSSARLEEVEDVVRRELERCAPCLAERLALRLLQGPVFHAHGLSVLVELEEAAEVSAVERALESNRVTLLEPDREPVTPVGVAGRDDIVVGRVVRDRKRPSSFWLWAAADNLRLTTLTAVEIAETLLP